VPVTDQPRQCDPALRTRQPACKLNSSRPHDQAPTQLHDHISDHIAMAKRIVCQCGFVIRGEDDEQVVERGREHMQANHPAIAAVITAEELLKMAEEE
jgi:predicted small metal-binding protein